MMYLKASVMRRLILLALFHACDGKIGSKTKLQKLPFFIQKAALENESMDQPVFEFMKYDHGPHSRELYSDVEMLSKLGLIKEEKGTVSLVYEGRQAERYDYQLTKLGEEAAKTAYEFFRIATPRFFDILLEESKKKGEKTATQLRDLSHDTPEYKDTPFGSMIYNPQGEFVAIEKDWEELEEIDEDLADDLEDLVLGLDEEFQDRLHNAIEEIESHDYEVFDLKA